MRLECVATCVCLRYAVGLLHKPDGLVEREKMKLLTKEIAEKLPDLYSQENESDPIAQVRFFSIANNWEWFGTEFDGADLFFGLVKGFETELGYFSLSELESVGVVERDADFTPKRLSEIR